MLLTLHLLHVPNEKYVNINETKSNKSPKLPIPAQHLRAGKDFPTLLPLLLTLICWRRALASWVFTLNASQIQNLAGFYLWTSSTTSIMSFGILEGAYFVGRQELLTWLNDFLKVPYTKVEQTANGAAACQIMDSIYPGNVHSVWRLSLSLSLFPLFYLLMFAHLQERYLCTK